MNNNLTKPYIVILAAGSSKRFKTDKMFSLLGGMPLFLHSVKTFLTETAHLVLVIPPGCKKKYAETCEQYGVNPSLITFIDGGSTRTASVSNALAYLRTVSSSSHSLLQLVAIHDAARPFATVTMLHHLCDIAQRVGGAAPGHRAVDTLLLADSHGNVQNAIPRDNVWHVSTPQVFVFDKIAKAYTSLIDSQNGKVVFSDDTQVFIANGGSVRLVEEDSVNLKITYPEDLPKAERFLAGC
ncbi:MAG: 2-C-methyl-D-erythritol 4-phosphate cytidylyltransferase [Victivallales bacterium]|nr:2-C-methyl-D-erythritol 4-phosphate cytidylyltransferase [Victivallales bacterium]